MHVARGGVINKVMVDEGTRREVWNGKIPVCFIVDQEEVGTTNIPPEPVFVSNKESHILKSADV